MSPTELLAISIVVYPDRSGSIIVSVSTLHVASYLRRTKNEMVSLKYAGAFAAATGCIAATGMHTQAVHASTAVSAQTSCNDEAENEVIMEKLWTEIDLRLVNPESDESAIKFGSQNSGLGQFFQRHSQVPVGFSYGLMGLRLNDEGEPQYRNMKELVEKVWEAMVTLGNKARHDQRVSETTGRVEGKVSSEEEQIIWDFNRLIDGLQSSGHLLRRNRADAELRTAVSEGVKYYAHFLNLWDTKGVNHKADHEAEQKNANGDCEEISRRQGAG